MLVITLTDCPPALKGDLTKWLQEINTGVYVGQVSARVREELWERVKGNVKKGRATMVYNANNEQRMDFRVHNTSWEPIDYDGLKLMLRPNTARLQAHCKIRTGYSKAAKAHMAKKTASHCATAKSMLCENLIVMDVETTGLSVQTHEIIEIGAVKTNNGKVSAEYNALIRPSSTLPPPITKLTGITDQQLMLEGRPLVQVLPEFLAFVGELPVVSHNAGFDSSFLREACGRCGLPLFANRCIDTLAMARRLIKKVDDYKLVTLADYFSIPYDSMHRSRNDCMITLQLYMKLIEIRDSKK